MLSFFANDWGTNRELLKPKAAFVESVDEEKQWDCLLLHGWHSLYFPLLRLEEAMRQVPGGNSVRYWRGTYDSHWKTFTRSAREFISLLGERRVRPERTILVGYSMGGLVARSMVMQGFGAYRVLSLATPHLGAAPWMPVGDVGSVSIAPWSARLARLNGNPVDAAARDRYCFVGFDFTDATGYQNHDRIVRTSSSLAQGLEGVHSRHTVHLNYQGIAPGCDPHLRGMDPDFLAPVLQEFSSWISPQNSVSESSREG